LSRTITPTRLAYPVAEAAELLGIKRTFLYDLIQRGAIPSTTIGLRRLIKHDDLVAYVDALPVRSAR
jgi:excisionase family DNA binding protein